MAGIRIPLTNFSKGVLSERLYRRTDVEAYGAALLRGENIVVLKYGGFRIRPGFRYVDETLAEGEQLFPFQFSMDQTYALAMGQGYMQPLAYGGFIVDSVGDEAVERALEGATQTDPVVLHISLHGYAVGDRILIPTGTVVGMTELNGRIWTVSGVPDDDHVEIDADGTGWGAFVSASGGDINVTPPTPPPPPPPVPPPPPPPPPPWVGGGGGGDSPGECVWDETPILLPSGEEVEARFLRIGDVVRTQHETTLEWGDHAITAIQFVWRSVYRAQIGSRSIRATPEHRFWIDGEWIKMREIGRPDGAAWVTKMTVADAHTYVSAGVLSHNIKDRTFYDTR